MGETGDTDLTGGGRTQGVGNFLQGGGAGNSIIWVGDMGNFRVNGKEGSRDTHRVPAADHRESGKVIRRRDMVDARGGRRMRGRGSEVGEDLYIETSGNRGSLGGATSLI